MKLFTSSIEKRLIKNYQSNAKKEKTIDHKVVVKLFNPTGIGTWYLTEYNPETLKRLKWLVGLTGSAGYLVVTIKALYLFVDGRYTLQSKSETKGLKIVIYDSGKFNLFNFFRLFQKKLHNIAIDPKLIILNNKKGI